MKRVIFPETNSSTSLLLSGKAGSNGDRNHTGLCMGNVWRKEVTASGWVGPCTRRQRVALQWAGGLSQLLPLSGGEQQV